ncbi:hypothetical protein [Amycolatopsis sp.]|uniref:hypothetical protein n=1 Tax=Amycolatopsis sp. TaxID=37632 RepID=UPI002DFAEDA5|nr:hypothetical protein [Amycolatopsis sp.]
MGDGMPSLRKFAALSLLAAGITLTGLGGVASAVESAAPTNAVGQVHLDSGQQTLGILCAHPAHVACW